MKENEIAYKVIGAAIEVHRQLGPGLLESAYQVCLKRELEILGIGCETEIVLPLNYKDELVDVAYRADMLVETRVLIELKVIKKIEVLHKAQLLTYLRLSKKKLGLLINFNELVLKDGIARVVNNL